MAKTIADLLIKLGVDTSQFQKEMARAERQLRKSFGSASIEASQTMAAGLTGLAAAFGAVGLASVKMAADMEQNRIAFTTMLGSATEADKLLRDMAKFAEQTPFEFAGIVDSSKKLLAMGYTAQEIIPIMTSIGDAVAAVGGSTATLDRITLAFAQMRAKGMVSAEEMKQLAENGIPAWQMLANVLGVTIPEAMKLAEDKAIDAESAISGLIKQMGEKYGGMMEKQSQTITGMFSNLKDKTSMIMVLIGEEIVDALDLRTKMQDALKFLDEFALYIQRCGIREGLLAMFGPELEVAIVAIAGAITASLIPALTQLAIRAWAALGPLGLIAGLAGAGIAVAGYSAYKRADMSPADYLDPQDYEAIKEQFPNQQLPPQGMGDLRAATESDGGSYNVSDYLPKPVIKPPAYTPPPIGGGSSAAADKAARDAERIASLNQKLTDELMKLTMDEYSYKEYEIDRWIETQKAAGADSTLIEQVAAQKRTEIIRDSIKEQLEENKRKTEEMLRDAESLTNDTMRLNLTSLEYEKWCLYQEEIAWNKKYENNKEMLDKWVEYRKAKEKELADKAAEEANRSKESWADALTGLITGTRSGVDILKQIWTEMVNNMIRSWFSLKQATGGLSGGGFLGGLFGGILGGGGPSGSVSSWADISSIAPSLIPAFAGGGSYGGGLALVGEKGPELINFNRGGYVHNASDTSNLLGANKQPNINVNVINNTGTQATAEVSQNFDGETAILTVVLNAMGTNKMGVRDSIQALGAKGGAYGY